MEGLSPEVKLQTLIDEIREIRDEKGVEAWKNKDKDHWVAYQMLRGGAAAVIVVQYTQRFKFANI